MRLTAFFVTLVSVATLQADTFYPMLMSVAPVAIQTGRESECEVLARYDLRGAYKVFVTGTGVTGQIDPPKIDPKTPVAKTPQTKIKVRFTVSPDALPGEREVRLATPLGVSTVGMVVVVSDPVVRETTNNDSLKTATPVELPATICGTIEKAEDVDVFRFKAKAGSSYTFHVRSQRLQDKIHDLQEHSDPIITLKNASGTVLAMIDNTFFADPLLNFRFPSDGEYFLEIRDVRYSGNVAWEYCIEAHDRPFVTNVHPMRVTPGQSSVHELVGYNLPADAKGTINVPKETPEGIQWLNITLNKGLKCNPVPVVVSSLPSVIESTDENNIPAKAQPITIPAGISGRISGPSDVDCYVFEAKAGEKLNVAVIARGHQSAIDPFIRILNEKGDRLLENDDFRDRFVHSDSQIENWTVPANGKYIIEIRDVHMRGGPSFVYFLQVTRAEPHFVLEIDTDKTLLSPGTASVIFVRATRKNGFEGEIQLAVEGLLPGVTAKTGKILAGGKDGCIHLSASPDAKISAENIRVTGTGTFEQKDKPAIKHTAIARPLQEIYMPGGGRYHYPVETHALSISSPLDIRSLKLSETDIRLKPGESKKIEITIERAPEFKQNVTLDVVYQHLGSIFGNSLPEGVTVDEKASLTLLTGQQSKGHITLKAAPEAKPVEKQLVPVMGFVSINFVMKFTYAGEPIYISVVK